MGPTALTLWYHHISISRLCRNATLVCLSLTNTPHACHFSVVNNVHIADVFAYPSVCFSHFPVINCAHSFIAHCQQCRGISMIHVSWYVSWYKNSIKYQVSWYIFGIVSVSVSLIHFGCISIINHWYTTVIHLRRTSKTTAAVNSSSTVYATVSRIQTMQPIATNYEVEDYFFDYGTIPSTDAAINAVDRECINYLSDTGTENTGKIQSNSESFRQVHHSSTIVCASW